MVGGGVCVCVCVCVKEQVCREAETWLSMPCALVGAHSPAPGLARSPHRHQTHLTFQPLDLYSHLFCVIS